MAAEAEEADKKAAFLAALGDLDAALAAAKPGPLFGGARLDATDAALAPKLYHALTALKHWKVMTVAAVVHLGGHGGGVWWWEARAWWHSSLFRVRCNTTYNELHDNGNTTHPMSPPNPPTEL